MFENLKAKAKQPSAFEVIAAETRRGIRVDTAQYVARERFDAVESQPDTQPAAVGEAAGHRKLVVGAAVGALSIAAGLEGLVFADINNPVGSVPEAQTEVAAVQPPAASASTEQINIQRP